MAAISRRGFLAGVAGVAVIGTAGCTVEYNGGGGRGGGIATGTTGSGFAYDEPDVTEADATHTARSADELLAALDEASEQRPAVIWLPGDAAIDMTGRAAVVEHAVIASNRTKESLGAIVYSDTQGVNSAAYKGGEALGVLECRNNARLTGFRHRGPTSNVHENEWYSGYIPMPSGSSSERDSFYDSQQARGISCTGENVQIDNMDIFGWPTQGITVGTTDGNGAANPQINNCSITQCGLTSAGYGVEVFRGHPTVYQVYFNGTRHAVAGFGYGNCSYSLIECEFGPANSLFQVDQHGLYENTSGSSSKDDLNYRYRAGGTMEIVRCTFTSTHVVEFANFQGGDQTPAIVIGGVPMDRVVVRGNQFSHPPVTGNPKTQGGGSNPPIAQGPIPPGHEQDDQGFCRFEIADNQYGMSFDFPVGDG
ncbi:hypothetical protein [Halalkalicoccus salilacus]|uniref:hypothetical protein n=1 Tax=Halalkalicoccus salilacus TaxID=3117459 RepID=UPI00300F4CB2